MKTQALVARTKFAPASGAAIALEFDQRREAARKQLVKLYGPDGIVDTGAPVIDILDKVLDSLSLSAEYMAQNDRRLAMMSKLLDGCKPVVLSTCREGSQLASEAMEDLMKHICKLIRIRQRLREQGLALGEV